MSETAKSAGGGIGCLTILGLIFITLKLAEIGTVANWSWWIVLSPFWIQAAIIFLVAFVYSLGAFVSGFRGGFTDAYRRRRRE